MSERSGEIGEREARDVDGQDLVEPEMDRRCEPEHRADDEHDARGGDETATSHGRAAQRRRKPGRRRLGTVLDPGLGKLHARAFPASETSVSANTPTEELTRTPSTDTR